MVGARTVYGLRYIAPQLKIPQSSTAAHMLRGRGGSKCRIRIED
jgi:hypothetical protein